MIYCITRKTTKNVQDLVCPSKWLTQCLGSFVEAAYDFAVTLDTCPQMMDPMDAEAEFHHVVFDSVTSAMSAIRLILHDEASLYEMYCAEQVLRICEHREE